MNNLPPLFGQQDQLTTCRDMLEAARAGKPGIGGDLAKPGTDKTVIVTLDKSGPSGLEFQLREQMLEFQLREQMLESMRRPSPWADLFQQAAGDAKIGTTLRIRLPAGFKVKDRVSFSIEPISDTI